MSPFEPVGVRRATVQPSATVHPDASRGWIRRMLPMEHLTRLSFSFYDRVQSGQLISRANSDIRSVQMFLAFAPLMVLNVVSFVGGLRR